MVARTLNGRTVWLSEDRRHFRRIQIARRRHGSTLDRDMEDFDALGDRRGILGGHEVEEAADRGKPAVARADCAAAFMFGVAEERNDGAGGQIVSADGSFQLPTSGPTPDSTGRSGIAATESAMIHVLAQDRFGGVHDGGRGLGISGLDR